jgi:ATP-dependent Lhr-like helicase
VLRFSGGRKVPPPIQRMRSDDLLAAVFPDQAACGENLVGDIRIPDHPLVSETIRDCLHEAMDLDGLTAILEGLERGDIETVAIDTAEPSPFSHEILNANPYAYLDDAPLEERRARAVQMPRTLGEDGGEIGALDPIAMAAVRQDSWPVVRDADELHDALLTLVAMPPADAWSTLFDELARSRRATCVRTGDAMLWAPAERLTTIGCLYPGSVLDPVIRSVERSAPDDREAAAVDAVRGWLESTGPTAASGLATTLALPRELVDAALLRLESDGQILRGRFTPPAKSLDREIEWCNRRLLARIHRLTLARLRSEVSPVNAADFVRFLCSWHHIAPGSQLHGVDGVLQILAQLQGYEVSAAAWESEVLPRRIAGYTPELLDRLCLSGEVMWGRLSPHPSLPVEQTAIEPEEAAAASGGRRMRPTRVAPVAIFLREDASWLLGSPSSGDVAAIVSSLSDPARDVADALARRGASFVSDLAKATAHATRHVEDALWELAAAGVVTADGFENLRTLIDPKRRSRNARLTRPRHAAGRWALLRPDRTDTAPPQAAGTSEARTEAFARQLLKRWGVVFRDLLARETLAPGWRELVTALRRMELRGEIRGGHFVAGFPGEQFARAEAIDLLRAMRRTPAGAAVRIAAADPLNLAGILTDAPRVSPLAAQMVEIVTGSDEATMAAS